MGRRALDLTREEVALLEVREALVDMHQDPNGPRLLGPNLVIELPLFD